MDKKSMQILEQLNNLEAVFDTTEVVADSINEHIEEKLSNIILRSDIIESGLDGEFMTLELLKEDLEFSRNTIKETVENSRKLLHILTKEIAGGTLVSPALIEAYSTLQSNVNSSVKLLSEIYKSMISVISSIENKGNNNTNNVTNNITGNTFISMSTDDVITKILKQQKNNEGIIDGIELLEP